MTPQDYFSRPPPSTDKLSKERQKPKTLRQTMDLLMSPTTLDNVLPVPPHGTPPILAHNSLCLYFYLIRYLCVFTPQTTIVLDMSLFKVFVSIGQQKGLRQGLA